MNMDNLDNYLSNDSFRRFLDNEDNGIYIVDAVTQELLYMNPRIKKLSKKAILHIPCYKAIMDEDVPCPDCPCSQISKNGFYKTKVYLKTFDLHVSLRVTNIIWEDRNAYLFSFSTTPEAGDNATMLAMRNELHTKEYVQPYTLTTIALDIFERYSDFKKAIHTLMAYIGNRFQLNRISLFLNNPQAGNSKNMYQWADRSMHILVDPSNSFRKEEFYLLYDMYEANGTAVLQQAQKEEYSIPICNMLEKNGAKTILASSITIDNKYMGQLMFLDFYKARTWSSYEVNSILEVTKIIASNAKKMIELEAARHTIDYYKNFDSLTGLKSYKAFKQEANQLLADSEERFVLVSSDIKNFKYINETIGYTQGDNMLRMLADMLTKNLPSDSVITRVSADYFLSLVKLTVPENEFVQSVTSFSEDFCNIQNEINTDIKLMIRTGICFIDKGCTEVSIAIDRATTARKSIQYMRTSTTLIYNEASFLQASKENQIIAHMEYALNNGEFKVYMQPKYYLKDNSLAGAEALIRWQKPDGTIIPPDEFIPLFEKNGFVGQIDNYVLHKVCDALQQEMLLGKEPIKVSVNLSAIDIQNKYLIPSILSLVDGHDIPHETLEFELTETAFLADSQCVFDVMYSLQKQGFQTSVDDFGSGYSIMNIMAEMPTDTIKIDRGFLLSCNKSERGQLFLRQLVSMINNMGFTSLCEGIETKEQRDSLLDMGCEIGQGFFFSRPMPMEEFFERYRSLM